jgi:hypothetical protein
MTPSKEAECVPRFAPWVGADYFGNGFNGVRLLIVGESHYGEEDISTADVIREHAIEKSQREYFQKIQSIVTGECTSTRDSRCSFWNSVAFYNYVQALMPTASTAPTRLQFRQSEPSFRTVLGTLAPDCLLATGYRLWDGMPALDVVHMGSSGFGAYLSSGGKSILSHYIMHPSSRGQYDFVKATLIVSELIEASKRT